MQTLLHGDSEAMNEVGGCCASESPYCLLSRQRDAAMGTALPGSHAGAGVRGALQRRCTVRSPTHHHCHVSSSTVTASALDRHGPTRSQGQTPARLSWRWQLTPGYK